MDLSLFFVFWFDQFCKGYGGVLLAKLSGGIFPRDVKIYILQDGGNQQVLNPKLYTFDI